MQLRSWAGPSARRSSATFARDWTVSWENPSGSLRLRVPRPGAQVRVRSESGSVAGSQQPQAVGTDDERAALVAHDAERQWDADREECCDQHQDDCGRNERLAITVRT